MKRNKQELVIKVEKVSKSFKLPHQKISSIKSVFLNALSLRNRTYEEQHALKDISFTVNKGEFFGIVGRNGSGKSTLLKLLAGIYQPSSGDIDVRGRIVPFIELGVGFNPELTGRENVYLNGAMLGFNDKQVDKKYDSIVGFAELEKFMDQKLKNYSSGMQVRLAFSVATILAESDILLLDEVLAVGDVEFQRKCFNYFRGLKRLKKTVIFISHDMNAIREFCDRAMLIDDSEVVAIGSSKDIASEYQKLFIRQSDESTKLDGKDSSERWGNFNAKYSDVKIDNKTDKLVVEATVECTAKLDSVYLGLHVFSDDGTEVTAMNNRMIGKPDIKNLKPGSSTIVRWEMQNIFNDGKYQISLTMADDAVGVIDWVTNAGKFTVRRKERSTTHVYPPTYLQIKRGAEK